MRKAVRHRKPYPAIGLGGPNTIAKAKSGSRSIVSYPDPRWDLSFVLEKSPRHEEERRI